MLASLRLSLWLHQPQRQTREPFDDALGSHSWPWASTAAVATNMRVYWITWQCLLKSCTLLSSVINRGEYFPVVHLLHSQILESLLSTLVKHVGDHMGCHCLWTQPLAPQQIPDNSRQQDQKPVFHTSARCDRVAESNLCNSRPSLNIGSAHNITLPGLYGCRAQ